MNGFTIIGIILLILGTGSLAFEKITYTKDQQVVNVGGVKGSIETKESVPLSPIAGIIVIIGGIVFIYFGARQPD